MVLEKEKKEYKRRKRIRKVKLLEFEN